MDAPEQPADEDGSKHGNRALLSACDTRHFLAILRVSVASVFLWQSRLEGILPIPHRCYFSNGPC
jgi:hypothetical protein